MINPAINLFRELLEEAFNVRNYILNIYKIFINDLNIISIPFFFPFLAKFREFKI
jgi:hypothetical protein